MREEEKKRRGDKETGKPREEENSDFKCNEHDLI
jgi:hypothetical protein